MKRWHIFLGLLFAFAAPALAQTFDPARIDVYITPFYNANGPTVEVGQFSKGLASKSEAEFVATIQKMKQSWNELRFPELYVAAIRLYELGFRNESIYWFYSAQYRGRVFAGLVDREKMGSIGEPGFELVKATDAFHQLVGPFINGFAFGDIDRLASIVTQVQKENKTVPDLEKLYPKVTFRPRAEWEKTNAEINDGLTKFLETLKDQKATIKKTRADNGTEAKFSKLTSKDLPK
jgi:hypothetical protein